MVKIAEYRKRVLLEYQPEFRLHNNVAGALEDAVVQSRPHPTLVHVSAARIAIQRHEFTPILLVYSSKYYLAVAEQWRLCFGLLKDEVFDDLSNQLLAWQYRK